MDPVRYLEVALIALGTVANIYFSRGGINEARLKEKIDTANLQSEARLIDKLDKRFISAELASSKLQDMDQRIRRNSQQIHMIFGILIKKGWMHNAPTSSDEDIERGQ